MSKQRLDAIMAQHLQAEVPWWPGQFVAIDITSDNWITEEEEVYLMVSVFVVDRFFKQMITTN